VADGQGTEMPSGLRGSVWVRGAGVSSTFVPAVTLRVRGSEVPIGRCHDDGWLRTGDIGSLDRDGRLTLCGREDDLVKVEGRRVALGEVEGCLEAFANVRSAEARLEYDEVGRSRVVARVNAMVLHAQAAHRPLCQAPGPAQGSGAGGVRLEHRAV